MFSILSFYIPEFSLEIIHDLLLFYGQPFNEAAFNLFLLEIAFGLHHRRI